MYNIEWLDSDDAPENSFVWMIDSVVNAGLVARRKGWDETDPDHRVHVSIVWDRLSLIKEDGVAYAWAIVADDMNATDWVIGRILK